MHYPDVPAWWILERNISRFADKTAILFLNYEDLSEIERLSYRDLWQRSGALAAGLRELGVKKGDRVATLLPNCPAIIISYYGIWMAGAAITPCNALASEKEFTHQLRDAGASILIAAETTADMALSAARSLGIPVVLAPVGEDAATPASGFIPFADLIHGGRTGPSDAVIDPREDMAVLLYTGGTTGDPKGAVLTHRNIVANTVQFAEWYALDPGKEIFVCTIPMSHSGGMSGVMNVPLYGGATLIVLRRFLPESVARIIEQYRATRFFGVPTMFVSLLGNEKARSCDMTSLKSCRTNASPLPVALKEEFDRLIGKEVLIEGYGLTETSPLTHANPIEKAKAGSIGIPLTDTDAKVIDLKTGDDLSVGQEGELVLRGPQIMKGYWGKPEATERAFAGGWFHTGDVVRMDEDGYFFIVDRVKDMINSAGYKVWPREVEEILYTHPKIRMAMIFGVPDDYYGETVKACIVPKDEAKETITKEEITAFCKKKMASYKVPKHIEFRDSLPISAQGKMLRRAMREEAKRTELMIGDRGEGGGRMKYFHNGDTLEKSMISKEYSSAYGSVIAGARIQVAMVHKEKGTGSRLHSHPNEQFNYVLKGELRARVEDEETMMKPGDLVHIPANAAHYLVAVSEGGADYFVAKDTSWGISGAAVDGEKTGAHYEPDYKPKRK